MKGSVGALTNITGEKVKRRLKVCNRCSKLYLLYGNKTKRSDLFKKTQRFLCSSDQEFDKKDKRRIWKDCDTFETWIIPKDCDFMLEHTVMSQGEVE